ncbi:MAG: hypothetical protein AAF677_00795 [Pseudomonadota bacterium]
MDAGTMLALAKLLAFALIVRAWMVARRSAEEARRDRMARAEAARETEAAAAAVVPSFQEAAQETTREVTREAA